MPVSWWRSYDCTSMVLMTTAQVHNSCFFEGARTLACGTLVANPPYIPAPDDNILMPALHGGSDGANLTRVRAGLSTSLCKQSNMSRLVPWVQ